MTPTPDDTAEPRVLRVAPLLRIAADGTPEILTLGALAGGTATYAATDEAWASYRAALRLGVLRVEQLPLFGGEL